MNAPFRRGQLLWWALAVRAKGKAPGGGELDGPRSNGASIGHIFRADVKGQKTLRHMFSKHAVRHWAGRMIACQESKLNGSFERTGARGPMDVNPIPACLSLYSDNILFGLPFDEERYQTTWEICALIHQQNTFSAAGAVTLLRACGEL
ncbi:hypothetical protein K503DRAFT_826870 [Rhizopogon vinicolor AM-OR11-026]|uniref:Uncharacterized protein n=1 Tax=Rhizopogon vinicolor AM-OR11-026 TaxID=1314800 RepID=A0A1B7MU18_9AGAM|nr:hypothetical protein K503DRAFT_826870 [Rhizopogon vinicolor AM-OR11-026]